MDNYTFGFRIDEYGNYGSWRYQNMSEAAEYLTGSPDGKCRLIGLAHSDLKDRFVALMPEEPAKKADVNLIGSTFALGLIKGKMVIFSYDNDGIRSVSRAENDYLRQIIQDITGKDFR